MIRKSFRPRFVNALTLFVLCLFMTAPAFARRDLYTIFADFKSAAKRSCGERDEAIRLGEQVIADYGNDAMNQDVIAYVKKKIAEIKENERTCARNNLYNNLYKNKFWKPFIIVSKDVIAEEGDSPLALDLILTMVSVGVDRPVDMDENQIDEMIKYAKLAIQKIEAGQTTKTGRWGVFEPFGTKEKARSWLNYAIGLLIYEKINPLDAAVSFADSNEAKAFYSKVMQNRESFEYFYKAMQYENDNPRKQVLYELIGDYYTDKIGIVSGEMNKISESRKGYADRALVAYVQAFKAVYDKPGERLPIYQRISEVYKYRTNLGEIKNLNDLDRFIRAAMNQRLPDLDAPVEPIFDKPAESANRR